MDSRYTKLAGSHCDAPAARRVGVVSDRTIEVSVYLKDRVDDHLLAQGPVARPLTAAAVSRGAIRAQRDAEYADGLAAVAEFAADKGLVVVGQDPARRLIKLSGTPDQLAAAFHTTLHEYEDASGTFRARSGSLALPADLAASVVAVLGLDSRPIATPKLRTLPAASATSGFLPNAVAALYGFPSGSSGASQCIGIIELGGGFTAADNAAAFAAMKLPIPHVVAIGVSGGTNAPGVDTNSDGEVALDIQVAGGTAPGATIAVYFAPNTSQGFVDAITRAVHDDVNKPSVLSISWGSAESNWTQQAIDAMTAAMRDAAQLGVTVFAASGDNLATDGASDGLAHVDFPASCPYVVGCGGTLLTANGQRIAAEQVWNNGNSGTGGGVSAKFPLPAYQSQAHVPAAASPGGRGVPDVAGDADPNSGYRVIVGGNTQQIGGTSAVAPLWAGLIAQINAATGKAAGFIHPVIYGNAAAFRDITTGNNKAGSVGFDAAAGWDTCTGLGSPDGAALLKVFE